MKTVSLLAALILGLIGLPLAAQTLPGSGSSDNSPTFLANETQDGTAVISNSKMADMDSAIALRLREIYHELDGLNPTQVVVDSGVVTLSGSVAKSQDIDRASQIARRVDGVVAVENNLKLDGDVSQNLAPVLDRLSARLQQIVMILPMLFIALVIIMAFWFLGSALERASFIWTRITSNGFLADLMASTARLLVVLMGVIIALDLLGATTLLGAILGSAGVVGLAIGFAVKDTIDNYVSSLMLSIRQPFRANDHVIIGDREGLVIRLTSRATVLMTLDGNHLRIPNSSVFRAEILNYTRNPERRFDFVLGVDAEDDPGEAIKVGTNRLSQLPFVLRDPAPGGRLEEVGDSNIILRFVGWINQTETDWFKARSAAIRAVKMTLEEQGFGLPEPIYRLRFDSGSPLEIAGGKPAVPATTTKTKVRPQPLQDHEDVSAEQDIQEKVNEERENSTEEDMLDRKRPIE